MPWEFYTAAKSAGVNPIVGCEVYVNTDNSSSLYHLTLLAEDAVGYRNLSELASLGYTQGYNNKPSINMEILRVYHGGIIALTGCINGWVPKLICSDQRDHAVRNLLELKDIMGEDNLFVEVQNHYLENELKVYPVMFELAKEYNLPIVGTNNCHFIRKSDHRMHDILRCIRRRKTINDTERLQSNKHYYFKNADEMKDVLKDYLPEAIFNTTEIANRCNLILDYDKHALLKYDVPDGYTQDSYLEKLCYDGLRQKYGGHLSEPIRKQLEYELDVIRKAAVADYFLIVADYVNFANKQGYLSSARGSAASSLVLFALDVISFNPMDHGCMFERFLNLDRMNTPDIDIDFADNARDEVINYLVNKYGHDSVGRIATFSTYHSKSVIKDVGRVLEVPQENITKITALIPLIPGITIDKVGETVPEFQKLAEHPDNRELIEISRQLEGMKRHVSCHASAIAIANGPISKYAPLFKDRLGNIATQFEVNTVEDVGIITFDTLGVRSLSKVADCLIMIKENHGRKIALEDIPLNDERSYSLISSGLIAGLFQLETSPGMFDVVTQLKPDTFQVFSAIIALYRPGPVREGMLQQFIDRKNGVQPIEYMHPAFEKALKNTFGVCLYQEQVMQIACDFAGYSHAEADLLRYTITRSRDDIIDEQQSKFIQGAIENGYTKTEADEIFDKLKSFYRYAFNKSHTVAYSLLSYRMAYLKTHFPHEFMAAIMSGETLDKAKINRYQTECTKLSDHLNVEINLIPSDINTSERDIIVNGNDICFGLVGVEGINDEVIDEIVTERKRNGKFKSLQDFLDRIDTNKANEQVVENLINSGAFYSLT